MCCWLGGHARKRGSVACSTPGIAILAVLGVVAYWISAPIMLGGLAVTLGVEGRRRAGRGRARMATVAIALGGLATAAGAILWLANV